VAIENRNNLGGTPEIVLTGSAAFFEFSADSQLVAGITTSLGLNFGSRGGAQIQLVPGGSPSSLVISVRVVPAN
jgi:hypothetical protein